MFQCSCVVIDVIVQQILKSLLWVKEVDENMLYALSQKVEPKRNT